MSSAPVIRRATPHDLDAVVRVDVRSFTRDWPADDFLAQLGDPTVVLGIALAGEAPSTSLGYVHVRLVGPEAELLNLAVDPAARRTGLGRRLLRWGQAEAAEAGVDRMFLEVRHDNVAALALYRAEGWQQVGIRKRYYSEDGADAVVMAVDLDAEDAQVR